MLLTFSHTTRYAFSAPVVQGLQRLKLKPKTTRGQEVLEWSMDLTGAQAETHYDDHHDTHTALASIVPGTEEVIVTCRGTVRTADSNGVVGPHFGHVPLWYFLRTTDGTRAGERVQALLASIEGDRSNTLTFLHSLSDAIAKRITYVPGATTAETTAEQALQVGKGVCQDHAHVFISAGRLLDIPMRYVSGYLKMDAADDQQAGHGWAEAHVAGLGWVGFDVSNGICPDERYIRVATGSDYGEAAPISGVIVGGGESRLDVSLNVGEKMVGQQQQQSADGGQQQRQGG